MFCNHYRAMSEHDTCKKGVAYETFKGMPFDKRPCFKERDEVVRCGCDLVQFPTAEEQAEAEKVMAKRFEGIVKAREAIVAHLGGPWKKGMSGAGGCIDCPACGNSACLSFSRAGYNGHIHAKCRTDGCVSWME